MPEELWRIPVRFPRYWVSTHGRVAMDTPDGRAILPTALRNGYPCVRIRPWGGTIKRFFVHRLVLETFVGPPPMKGMHTRHLDGDPSNNRLENLRWGTPEENSADRVRHGRAAKKLDPDAARAIFEMCAAGMNHAQIGARFRVSANTVRGIWLGRIWRHATGVSPRPAKA